MKIIKNLLISLFLAYSSFGFAKGQCVTEENEYYYVQRLAPESPKRPVPARQECLIEENEYYYIQSMAPEKAPAVQSKSPQKPMPVRQECVREENEYYYKAK